jgi:APA family basic amino acid/polyamine antiporter
MVSIGTLLAFVIVCAAVMILRVRRPDLQRPFRTPWVPFVPVMGIIVSLGLMASLNRVTWVRLIVWLIIGLIIYFTYGVKHSKVRNAIK